MKKLELHSSYHDLLYQDAYPQYLITVSNSDATKTMCQEPIKMF